MERRDKILVSACLAGVKCRYDGKDNAHAIIEELVAQGRAILVCPEQSGGLPTPRPACEILVENNTRKVLSISGEDCSVEFEKGARHALKLAADEDVKYAILKAKSPSCGCGEIYDGSFQRKLIPGNGITTQLLLDHGVIVLNENNADLKSILTL